MSSTFVELASFAQQTRHNPDDSSDDDVESESPLDEYQKPIFIKSQYHGPPTSLSIRRQRRDSRSDTSGSSAGDLGEITPCNASPHMTGMISYRSGKGEHFAYIIGFFNE